MATMNSGPGAILAPAAGFEDSCAVGFMRRSLSISKLIVGRRARQVNAKGSRSTG
jgi:hypothetical protein